MKRKAKFDQILFECQYVAALKAVDAFFDDFIKSRIWMKVPNPLLGNVSPIAMIKVGRFAKLLKFIKEQIKEGKRNA